jgi:hypothetical protein
MKQSGLTVHLRQELHMQVVRFGLVALLATVIVSPLAAQSDPSLPVVELSGAYSVNSDFIANRNVIVVVDQKVSPFFSHGSGPRGFEFSLQRSISKRVGFEASFSSYSDLFTGGLTYCQPNGCGVGLTFRTPTRVFYGTAGPVFTVRNDRRVALFVHALGGVVHARSTFAASGTDVQYVNPFHGAGLILFNHAFFPMNPSVSYSDSNADTGLAAAVGGGVKIRITSRSRFRVGMDYDPTWLVRPVITNATFDATTPSDRQRQGHIRLSMGITWALR